MRKDEVKIMSQSRLQPWMFKSAFEKLFVLSIHIQPCLVVWPLGVREWMVWFRAPCCSSNLFRSLTSSMIHALVSIGHVCPQNMHCTWTKRTMTCSFLLLGFDILAPSRAFQPPNAINQLLQRNCAVSLELFRTVLNANYFLAKMAGTRSMTRSKCIVRANSLQFRAKFRFRPPSIKLNNFLGSDTSSSMDDNQADTSLCAVISLNSSSGSKCNVQQQRPAVRTCDVSTKKLWCQGAKSMLPFLDLSARLKKRRIFILCVWKSRFRFWIITLSSEEATLNVSCMKTPFTWEQKRRTSCSARTKAVALLLQIVVKFVVQ